MAAIAGALVVLVGAGWFLFGGGGDPAPDDADANTEIASDADLPVLPWEAAPAETTDAPKKPVRPAEKDGVAIGGPGSMPPASVGNNGSYDPRPASERERIDPASNLYGVSKDDAAILLGDSALAPFSAPEEIQGVISAANQITDQPYVWGGGHAGWRSKGYDCSGAVSYALAGGGLINRPATSGELMGWGEPGRGKWLTVYASPSHTYAVVAGLRWDTAGNARGEGPRWHAVDPYPNGYVARHIPGL